MNELRELCIDEQKLFSSAFLEPFNEDNHRMDFPEATEEEVRGARLRHLKGSAIAIPAARKVCASCPMLKLGCTKSVLETPANEVYGVVGGLTQETRSKMQKDKKKTITIGDVFANPEGDIASQAAYSLVTAYTAIAAKKI